MSPSLPKTFKAAVVEEANGKLIIKDVPLEDPKHGEVLVKVKACGVCHSDEAVRTGAFGQPYATRTPPSSVPALTLPKPHHSRPRGHWRHCGHWPRREEVEGRRPRR